MAADAPTRVITADDDPFARRVIKAALQANSGRLEATAKALGISRKGLYLKRQRLGV